MTESDGGGNNWAQPIGGALSKVRVSRTLSGESIVSSHCTLCLEARDVGAACTWSIIGRAIDCTPGHHRLKDLKAHDAALKSVRLQSDVGPPIADPRGLTRAIGTAHGPVLLLAPLRRHRAIGHAVVDV